MANVGWIAACTAALFHGSFTVPMKGKAANSVNIDPFVFQTFKTSMCFLTCWAVLLLDETVTYSPLGIASGFLWVIGGTCGIFAVRNAGIALSVGIWSSIIVLVSYLWGVIIFDEPVHSRFLTFISILSMILGLCGMSYASTNSESPEETPHYIELTEENDSHKKSYHSDEFEKNNFIADHEDYEEGIPLQKHVTLDIRNSPSTHLQEDKMFIATDKSSENLNRVETDTINTIEIFGVMFTRRNAGIIGAICNGTFSGTSFVPMHYLSEDEKGLSFIISFAIGAAIVTLSFWMLRLLFSIYRTKSVSLGYNALPSFHLRVMWLPGGFSGLIWSIGNIGNILAVSTLGQTIGVSLGQASMIVSGLWGIFWYHEIVEPRKILLWFISAIITCISITALCYEHIK